MDDSYPGQVEEQQGLPMPGLKKPLVVTWALLGANIAIWLVLTIAGGSEDSDVLLDFGAMFGPLIANGEYWRLFTAMFLHVGVYHLAFNGFALFIFGPLVERAYGPVRFVTIYVLAGLFGSVASYLMNSISIGAGASGAIFGVLGALAAFFVTQRKTMSGGMAQRSLVGLVVLAGINIIYGFVSPGIDNWAHIGGLAAGFILGLALAPEFRMARSPFGTPLGLADGNSLARRWWVVPGAVGVLIVGTWLATATLPDNAYSHVYAAERLFQQQDYPRALREIEKATRISIDRTLSVGHLVPAVAQAYLLRGQIFAELGDFEAARGELTVAISLGDSKTRAEASALLVALLSQRN